MPDNCEHIYGLLIYGTGFSMHISDADDDRTKRDAQRFKYFPLCGKQINDEHDFK